MRTSSGIARLRRSSLVHSAADDSNALRQQLQAQRCRVVIPCNPTRSVPYPYNRRLYRRRHRIENLFQRLRRYRRVAMRFEKLAINFLGMVLFAAALTWIL